MAKLLDSFFIKCTEVEYKNPNECLDSIRDKTTQMISYFKTEYTIPATKYEVESCLCMRPHKGFSFKDETRPFFLLNPKNDGGDLISDFECNSEYSVYIGGCKFDTKRVLLLGIDHPEILILVYLDVPVPEEIVFSLKRHYFSNDIRVVLKKTDHIIDGEMWYSTGQVGPKPFEAIVNVDDFANPKSQGSYFDRVKPFRYRSHNPCTGSAVNTYSFSDDNQPTGNYEKSSIGGGDKVVLELRQTSIQPPTLE
jgi:hypothetical protein